MYNNNKLCQHNTKVGILIGEFFLNIANVYNVHGVLFHHMRQKKKKSSVLSKDNISQEGSPFSDR